MENQHEILSYIKDNPVAIISTLSREGELFGAAVYICALAADQIYFVTKSDTQKLRNIHDNPQVAVTIANAAENSSLQAQGKAAVVSDAATVDLVMSKLTAIYAQGADWLPPITKIRAGTYQVVSIAVSQARLARYKGSQIGDKHIFKEL